ncbi:GNAT family N-acetyltransferase [Sphaerisporangium viridialbum]|uniref:GNAT family N-acetyltransferase n=1 Tax=Sphaerisporangium viridialbum TaxID=46189 RepID=UPI003C734E9E
MHEVREMREQDIETVSSVRVAGWRTAYAGILPQAYLDGLSAEQDARGRRKRFARAGGDTLDLVAEDSGTVVGWLAMGPCRDDDAGPGDGEVYAFYVRPDRIGTGAGRALAAAALRAARERSYERLLLWVLEDNLRARRFYGSAGYVPEGSRSLWEVAGVAVPELRYHRDVPRPAVEE